MKTSLLTTTPMVLVLGWLLPAGSASCAEPAPKLVHRPLPGLSKIQPTATPAFRKTPPRPGVKPAIEAVVPERARIVFIHRRGSLPLEMTKDLGSDEKKTTGPRAAAGVEPVPGRQGKIRIIPKAEVASLLGQPEAEPATPPKP